MSPVLPFTTSPGFSHILHHANAHARTSTICIVVYNIAAGVGVLQYNIIIYNMYTCIVIVLSICKEKRTECRLLEGKYARRGLLVTILL